MKSKIFLCLIFVFSFSFLSKGRDFPNLIYNPSFEIDEDANLAPDDWNGLSWNEEEVRTGSYAIKLQGTGSYKYHNQPLNLIPNTDYTLSAWVKTTNATGGSGIWVAYQQLEPSVVGYGTPSVSGTTGEWTKIEVSFTTAANHESGRLDIRYDFSTSGYAWIDDISLEPDSGTVPHAAMPSISPDGGASDGPVMVTMTTATENATIRYTTDGTEPDAWSTEYHDTFELRYPCTVRAKVFHGGYQPSTVRVSSAFDVNPNLTNGVPFYPCDWSQDVEEWWGGHPYNKQSPIYVSNNIVSPSYTVDVWSVWQSNPGSDTAGIEESLAMLPSSGGTLYFRDDQGVYDITAPLSSTNDYYEAYGCILVLRKNNIHFVSEDTDSDGTGAVIRCARPAFGFASMEYADTDAVGTGYQTTFSHNFYFKNLVFDGNTGVHPTNNATHFFMMRNMADVLFDQCRFQNFSRTERIEPDYHHPGTISASQSIDNMWVRDCYFQDGLRPVYWDGVHGGGVIDSVMTNASRAGIMLFTNDDLSLWSAQPRSTEFFIMSSNLVTKCSESAIVLAGGHSLVVDNVVEEGSRYLVSCSGRYSDIIPTLKYPFIGNKVLRNRVKLANGLDYLIYLRGNYKTDASYSTHMDFLIRDNVVDNMDNVLWLETKHPMAQFTNIVFEHNYFEGENDLPQVYISTTGGVDSIIFRSNDFVGTSADLLVDNSGGLLPPDAITFPHCRTNPTQVVLPRILPAGGFYTGAFEEVVGIMPVWPDGDTYYTLDGSTPSASSTLYTSPFTITTSMTVKAITIDSGYTDSDVDVEVFGYDNQVPTVPTGLFVVDTNTLSVRLSWNASSDNEAVAGYYVYRDGSLLQTVYTNACFDDGLTTNTTYLYSVSAFDGASLESATSTAVSVTTRSSDTEAPSTPTGLQLVQRTETGYIINWSASTDNDVVAGYRIYRNGEFIGLENQTQYLHWGLSPGQVYTNQIQAYDVWTNLSSFSSSLIVTTAADQASSPEISPNGGTYSSPVLVSISTTQDYAWIRYTIDGSDPTESSQIYTGSFNVVTTLVVKARGYATNYLASETVSASFVITTSGSLPTPWQAADVGSVVLTGTSSYSSATFTLEGAGADIWGAADAFHYVYQTLPGDGYIQARIATLENVNIWTKCGVMIRETLGAGSKNMFVFITPNSGNGVRFQKRTSTDGGTVGYESGTSETVPQYLKLVRSGNTFSAYMSEDGSSWTNVYSSQSLTMSNTVTIGLALTSHDTTELATSSIDNVLVVTTNTTYTIVASSGDHGAISPSGNVEVHYGNDQQFSMLPNDYYSVSNVIVDGESEGTVSAYTFSNVAAGASISVGFAADIATNGTPHWWLADHGWTTGFDAAESSDSDGDGFTAGEEYIAGTQPTNGESFFYVDSVTQEESAGTLLSWPAVNDRIYQVEWTTNLQSNFQVLQSGISGVEPYTVTTDSTHSAEGSIYYRIQVQH